MVNFVIKWKIFILPNLHRPPQNNPPIPMHLCQRFLQSSKHAEKSSVVIAFNARTVSRSISSIDSKQFPRSGLLRFGNSQKSHGAKSVEDGGCGAKCVEFFGSRRIKAVCDGALSWCKIQELLAHNSSLFLRIANRIA